MAARQTRKKARKPIKKVARKVARKVAPKRPAKKRAAPKKAAAKRARAKPAAKKPAARRTAEVRGLIVERPKQVRARGGNGEQKSSTPPPPPSDAIEVSGIYERVMYSENDPFAEVREIFSHYDRDKSGSIDSREFARVCDALGVEMAEDELQVGLTIVDADGDGRINWDEFLGWWRAR